MKVCDFPFLTEDLPEGVTLDGEFFKADFSVSTVLAVLTYKGDPLHRFFYAYLRLFPDYRDQYDEEHDLALVNAAWPIIEGYPTFGSAQGAKKPPTLEWVQDSPAIVSSFRSVYGMSLDEVRRLHWWEFLCLLDWLPSEDNALGTIRKIRGQDIPAKASPEYKAQLRKAKNAYAIRYKPGEFPGFGDD